MLIFFQSHNQYQCFQERSVDEPHIVLDWLTWLTNLWSNPTLGGVDKRLLILIIYSKVIACCVWFAQKSEGSELSVNLPMLNDFIICLSFLHLACIFGLDLKVWTMYYCFLGVTKKAFFTCLWNALPSQKEMKNCNVHVTEWYTYLIIVITIYENINSLLRF